MLHLFDFSDSASSSCRPRSCCRCSPCPRYLHETDNRSGAKEKVFQEQGKGRRKGTKDSPRERSCNMSREHDARKRETGFVQHHALFIETGSIASSDRFSSNSM